MGPIPPDAPADHLHGMEDDKQESKNKKVQGRQQVSE
jgi:hypothetical protein